MEGAGLLSTVIIFRTGLASGTLTGLTCSEERDGANAVGATGYVGVELMLPFIRGRLLLVASALSLRSISEAWHGHAGSEPG